MIPKTTKIGNKAITYLNEKELHLMEKDIFGNQVYNIPLKSNNPLIFDVGANIGLATIYFKNKYPNSTIYSFEPNPNVFPILESNIFSNDIDGVKLFNIALGKKASDRELFIDISGSGAFYTSSFNKDAWDGTQKTRPILVKTEKLSKYIEGRIDLLKIDTEGAEYEILQELDISNSLKNIENIVLEYHPIKKGRLKKIIRILTKNNFTVKYYKDGKETNTDEEGLLLVVAKKTLQ